MDAEDQLRFALVSQKGRISSNFLEQAGWVEKVMHYVGFSPIREDVKRAEFGIASAKSMGNFLADTEGILNVYKGHIAAFQVATQINFKSLYSFRPI
jgi:hypothetical protein